MEEIVPMFQNEGGVDRSADMVGQRWIDVGFLESMELPVLEVAKPGCEALADQSEQREDVIAGAAGISKELFDLQDRVVVEQAIEPAGISCAGVESREAMQSAPTESFGKNLKVISVPEEKGRNPKVPPVTIKELQC